MHTTMATENNNKNLNVPNLRFPEFSGEWERKKLGDIGTTLIGLTYSPQDVVTSDGIIVLRSSNIKGGLLDYTDLVRVNKKIKETIITRTNDILICARNGSARLIGKNAILKDSDCGHTFGAFMMVYRSEDNPFVHQLLSTKRYYSQVAENLGARINQITTSDLNSFEFSFPQSNKEKVKIAGVLSLLDERIATQIKIIEDLKKLKSAISKTIFTGNKFECHQTTLVDVADIYQPQTIPTSLLCEENEYNVYGANGIIGKYSKYNHEASQICIACRGNSCGAVNYSTPKSWITGNAMVINTDGKDVDKRYLYHLLCTINFTPLISGSGQPQIVRSPLEKMKIRLPNLPIQRNISKVLDDIESKIEIEEEICKQFMKQKSGLLSQMFI